MTAMIHPENQMRPLARPERMAYPPLCKIPQRAEHCARDRPVRYRWKATAVYRHDSGVVDVTHDLEELADLHDRIDKGPHWDTVERIVIERVNHVEDAGLTVEQSRRL
jgi:hypothetical protein